MKIRTYSELMTLPTFKERFEYLKLDGVVGKETFGYDRYLNQKFYQRDPEWASIRNKVIIRDCGCDLGIKDRQVPDGVPILIHHMNPITKDDIINRTDRLLNPEYLICTIKNTHDAIHFGNEDLLIKDPVARTANDTCPWKR